MGNFMTDFMGNWVNSTYKYLKESGGGPTYPPKPVTVGPSVLPTGAYSLVEDVGISEIPIRQYGYVPLPFNPDAMGLPGTASSQVDAINEIAKENALPPVVSSNFQRLYPPGMNACIADQMHGHNNPDARSACQKLADMGDVSEMILNPAQKELIGLRPLPEQNAKSTEVLLAENEVSLTGQVKTGLQEVSTAWKGFAMGTSALVKRDPSGNKTITGDPAGNNFQILSDKLKAFLPGMPSTPDLNSPIILIGGAVVLVVLLIAIVK